MLQNSRSAYISRWGNDRQYGVYFGAEADAGFLSDIVAAILNAARIGHSFTLLLHRRQYKVFRKMGWDALHTGITLLPLSFLFPLRDFLRKVALLRSSSPHLLLACGSDGIDFPGADAALSREELITNILADNNSDTRHMEEAA